MTNTLHNDIQGILAQIAQSQLTTQQQLEGTQQQEREWEQNVKK
ncbi:MAG: hypothetical protein WBA41_22815 [Rivularia sp. (in: cyanobacteria)]